MLNTPALVKNRFVRYVGRTITVSLQNMALTGVLKEVEDAYLAVETNVDGVVETVFIFIPGILALKVEDVAPSGPKGST